MSLKLFILVSKVDKCQQHLECLVVLDLIVLTSFKLLGLDCSPISKVSYGVNNLHDDLWIICLPRV